MDKIIQKCLDVGCGPYKNPNAIGIDQFPLKNVDIVCDLNQPWPLLNQQFEKVIFRHSINHLNDIRAALSEAARVTRPGGIIEIIAPHFSSDNIFTDPTVKFFTGYRTLDYYCKNVNTCYKYYADLSLLLDRRWIYLFKSTPRKKLDKVINKFLYPLEYIINKIPRIYEKFLCFILRANEIRYVLRVE